VSLANYVLSVAYACCPPSRLTRKHRRGRLFECTTRPLLFHHDNRLLLNFAREPLLGLGGVARRPGLASLSAAQREALDVVEAAAKSCQATFEAAPGDMLFVNNHAVLHSREAFVDAPGLAQRYLVRLWLRNPTLAWRLPTALRAGHARIYGENELGERWNVVDVPRVRFCLSERLTS